jgi:hypothetical protein
MVRHAAIGCMLTLFTSNLLFGADPENPFKKAKKGQWISYHLDISINKVEQKGAVKLQVTDVTDKSATIEITSSVNGEPIPSAKRTIDFDKPYDVLSVSSFPAGPDTKIEKKESGKETLEIDGKKYECEWTRYTMSSAKDANTKADIKLWISKDVPLHGMAKMEIDASNGSDKVKMVIDKFGK